MTRVAARLAREGCRRSSIPRPAVCGSVSQVASSQTRLRRALASAASGLQMFDVCQPA
jgi:hypothetical protein